MIRIAAVTAILCLTLFLGGCAGMIDAKAVDPLWRKVIARHDDFVNAGKHPDGSQMSDVQKRTYLRSTEIIGKQLDAAKK